VDPRRYRQIYAALSQRIADGTYAPGSPLPPLGVLADEFDVSRDTAQRAVHMLADEDKVLRFPGLGWYVAE
jgi:DNA-binding GntR family transcriptional regulator